MLKLIKELGLQEITPGVRATFAIYECPQCGGEIRCRKTASKTLTVCRPCGHLNRAVKQKSIKQETVLSRIKLVHGSTYTYDRFVYSGRHELATITCKQHGDFKQSVGNHLNGAGCPTCAQSVRSILLRKKNDLRPATLYYIYFPELNLYKIGVTVDMQQRFRGEKYIHTVLFTKEFPTEMDAYLFEEFLLNHFLKFKYVGEPLLNRGGSSELITQNVCTQLKKLANEYLACL